MYCCGARLSDVGKRLLINWRAEPATTPLVEQAPYGACVWWVGFWWEQKSALLAAENGPGRPTGKAERLKRVMTPRERKLRGDGKLVWVRDTADWNHPAKGGASTNTGFFKQSGIHAADEVGS